MPTTRIGHRLGRDLSRATAAFAALLLLIGACGRSGLSTVPTPVPATFTLAYGQSGRAVNTEVQFLGVVEDSRCPLNANCVQAGDVKASFKFTVGKASAYFPLQLADPAKRTFALSGYIVELKSIAPYPAGAQAIKTEDYRATVDVRSTP